MINRNYIVQSNPSTKENCTDTLELMKQLKELK